MYDKINDLSFVLRDFFFHILIFIWEGDKFNKSKIIQIDPVAVFKL